MTKRRREADEDRARRELCDDVKDEIRANLGQVHRVSISKDLVLPEFSVEVFRLPRAREYRGSFPSLNAALIEAAAAFNEAKA